MLPGVVVELIDEVRKREALARLVEQRDVEVLGEEDPRQAAMDELQQLVEILRNRHGSGNLGHDPALDLGPPYVADGSDAEGSSREPARLVEYRPRRDPHESLPLSARDDGLVGCGGHVSSLLQPSVVLFAAVGGKKRPEIPAHDDVPLEAQQLSERAIDEGQAAAFVLNRKTLGQGVDEMSIKAGCHSVHGCLQRRGQIVAAEAASSRRP